ncbi:MAG: DUF6055 domain-containing protein [Myxococcota bacterium]
MVVGQVFGWLATAWAGAGPPLAPCATMALLPHATPLRREPIGPSLGGLQVRDAFGVPNHDTSDHFAIHWGNSGGVDPSQIDRLLEAFELAWQVQIDEMGHPAPDTTQSYYFNVYIGDTGGGTPSGYGTGGYYYTDPEGFPMVVISYASLFDPDFADHAAQHEFYHAIQGSLARYTYDGPAAWYWEATAEWAAISTDTSNPTNGPFVFGYLLLPSLPVDFFDYPDTGALQEYFQYGAFVFPYDVTTTYGFEIVRDTWMDLGSDPDPLEVMRARVADAGGDLDQAWLDHLAHNVVYDYDAGALYREITEYYEPFYAEAHRIADTVSGAGGAGTVDGGHTPHRYGAAAIELRGPATGTLEVRIDGQPTGTGGSDALYGARVVQVAPDGSFTYTAVPFDGVHGELDLPGVGTDAAVYLTVGAWTPQWRDNRWLDEQFPFDWSLAVVEPTTTTTTPPSTTDPTDTTPTDPTTGTDDPPASDGPSAEDPGGCACASTTTGSAGWAWLTVAGAALSARSSRRTHRRR